MKYSDTMSMVKMRPGVMVHHHMPKCRAFQFTAFCSTKPREIPHVGPKPRNSKPTEERGWFR